MKILAIKTDVKQAELLLNEGEAMIDQVQWHAHRELSVTITKNIDALLLANKLTPHDLNGIVIFSGPGSFTGLRIGAAVANAMAYSLEIPIVGSNDSDWLKEGARRLLAGENQKIVLPEYGGEANITKPRK